MSILQISVSRAALWVACVGLVACGGGSPSTSAAPARRPEAAPASAAARRTTPAAPTTTAASRQAIAIVVNPHTAVSDITFAELRRIFMGDQQYWKDHAKVTLLVRAPTSRERSVVLEKIYRMSEDQFHEYWIGKMFRAEVAGGPKIVYSTDMAINLIESIKGAITFVPANAVSGDVKVLRIDGKLPSDPGYPLR